SDSATRAGLDAAALIAAQPARWATVNFIGRIGRGAEQAAQVACDDLHLTPLLLDVSRFAASSSADRAEPFALLGPEALLGRRPHHRYAQHPEPERTSIGGGRAHRQCRHHALYRQC